MRPRQLLGTLGARLLRRAPTPSLAFLLAGCLWAGLSAGCSSLPSEPPAEAPAEDTPPIVIRWSTANEFENYGYHVYRGLDAEGPFERLTEEAIPGAGTTDLPQHYRFEDPSAEPGVVYYYYVESVSMSGVRKRFTPVRPFELTP